MKSTEDTNETFLQRVLDEIVLVSKLVSVSLENGTRQVEDSLLSPSFAACSCLRERQIGCVYYSYGPLLG